MILRRTTCWLTWLLTILLGLMSFKCACFQPGKVSAEELMNWNPSPEEMAELEKMVEEIRRTDPKLYAELERQGQQILHEAGINPADFQQAPQKEEVKVPIEKPIPSRSTPDKIKPQKQNKPEPQGIRSLADVIRTIEKLQTALRSIHIKAQVDHEIARVLTRFKKEITDLLYYLPVIKDEKIAKHITTQEFTNLFSQLSHFAHDFEKINNQIIPQENPQEEVTPYLILGIKPGSSWEKIEQAYKTRKKSKDISALKKQLKHEVASEQEALIALRKNELQLLAIEQAYTTLKDPTTRKRFERELAIRINSGLNNKKTAQPLLKELSTYLTEAIYEAHLLNSIKDLIIRYNPEAEEIKKEREEAQKNEESRKDELKKKRITPSQRVRQSGQTYYESPSINHYSHYSPPTNYSNFSIGDPFTQPGYGGHNPNPMSDSGIHKNGPISPSLANEKNPETEAKEEKTGKSDKNENTKEEKPACEKKKEQEEELQKRIKTIEKKFTQIANLRSKEPTNYQKKELEKLTKQLRIYKRKYTDYTEKYKPDAQKKEELANQWRASMINFSDWLQQLDEDTEMTDLRRNGTNNAELASANQEVSAIAQAIDALNQTLRINLISKNKKIPNNLSLEKVKKVIDKRAPKKEDTEEEDDTE